MWSRIAFVFTLLAWRQIALATFVCKLRSGEFEKAGCGISPIPAQQRLFFFFNAFCVMNFSSVVGAPTDVIKVHILTQVVAIEDDLRVIEMCVPSLFVNVRVLTYLKQKSAACV